MSFMICTLEKCDEGNIVPKSRYLKGEWGNVMRSFITCTLEQCAEGNIVPKRRDIKGEWRKCNEELHDLYPRTLC
jgi:hypothetical protein